MFTKLATKSHGAIGIAGMADKGDFIMVIRRIVGGALAAAAIASGVGVLAAPTAAAMPQRCGVLIQQHQSAFRQWVFAKSTYGENSPRAQAADRAQVIALARVSNAGC
jgi:hypothetical protein